MPHSVDNVLARLITKGLPIGSKEAEEELYAVAAEEVRSKDIVVGLMAKAFADMSGDEKRAGATYMKRRVQGLERELRTALRGMEEEERLRQEESRRQEEEDRSASASPRLTYEQIMTWAAVVFLLVITVLFLVSLARN